MSMVVQLSATVANDVLTFIAVDFQNASIKEVLVTDGVVVGTKIHNVTAKAERSKSGVTRILVQDRVRLNVPSGANGWSDDGKAWEEDLTVHTVVTVGPKLSAVLQNSGQMDPVAKATIDRAARIVAAVLFKDNSLSGVASSASTLDLVKNALIGAPLIDTQSGAYGKSV